MKVIKSEDIETYLKGYIEGCTPRDRKETNLIRHLRYIKKRLIELFEIEVKDVKY